MYKSYFHRFDHVNAIQMWIKEHRFIPVWHEKTIQMLINVDVLTIQIVEDVAYDLTMIC
jgi:hypothetical protein